MLIEVEVSDSMLLFKHDIFASNIGRLMQSLAGALPCASAHIGLSGDGICPTGRSDTQTGLQPREQDDASRCDAGTLRHAGTDPVVM